MSDEKRLEIAFVAAVIGFIFFLIRYFSKKPTKIQRFAEKAKENGCVQTAQAVSRRVNAGTGDISDPERMHTKVFVKYSYVVNGKDYIKSVMYKKGWSTSTDYPFEITVYYDKNNPKKAYSHFEVNSASANKKANGCSAVIFGPMFILVLVYLMLDFIQ